MDRDSRIIGIDLGTTNSVVAIVEGNEPIVIPNQEGANKTPSVVAFLDNNECIVGEIARRQAATNPERTISSIKRIIGLDYDEADDQLPNLPYEVVNHQDKVLIDINGLGYSPEQISSMIIKKLKESAEAYLGQEVTQAVVTVPANFNDSQRNATLEAARLANIEVLRLLNEPTAAALAYGLGKSAADEEVIAIYDFGGGTFDITILEISDKTFEVLTSTGDARLGGDDLDNAIVNRIVEEFQDEHGVDLREDPVTLRRLKEVAEKAKCELSTASQTMIALPFIAYRQGQPLHLERQLTRDEFEEMIEPFVNRTVRCCKRAIEDAGLNKKEIEKVILVGGSTRIPLVQDAVEDFFGLQPFKGINPDEVVAMGAATQAGVFSGNIEEVTLLDVAPHSLGIEVKDGKFSTIIEKNATIPIKAAKNFTTTEDNQNFVNIHILQGESTDAADNRSLGKFILTGIPAAPKGSARIRVTFFVNADGVMEISAEELGSGIAKSLTIVHSALDETEKKSRRRARQRRQKSASPGRTQPAKRYAADVGGGPTKLRNESGTGGTAAPGNADSSAVRPRQSVDNFAMLGDTNPGAAPTAPVASHVSSEAIPLHAPAATPIPPGAPAEVFDDEPAPPPKGSPRRYGNDQLTNPSSPIVAVPPGSARGIPVPEPPPAVPPPSRPGTLPSMAMPSPAAVAPAAPAQPAPTPPPTSFPSSDRKPVPPPSPAPPKSITDLKTPVTLVANDNSEVEWPGLIDSAIDMAAEGVKEDDAMEIYTKALDSLNAEPWLHDGRFAVMRARAMIQMMVHDVDAMRQSLTAMVQTYGTRHRMEIEEAFDRAMAQFQANAGLRRDRAHYRETSGNLEGACEDLEVASKAEPDAGDQDHLERLYKARMAKGEDPAAQFKLVKIYLKTNRVDEAIEILQDLQHFDAYETRAVKILGLCHWQKNLHFLAWQKFKQLKQNEEIRDILYRLAVDMESSGQLNNALTVFEHIGNESESYRDVAAKIKKLRYRIKIQQEDTDASRANVLTDARFVILEEINRGSMGIIYKARDKTLDEVVALKVLNDYLCSDPSAVERFKREARAAKKLSHPYIVRIHDMFESGNKRFISMEYIEGTDFKRMLTETGQLPEDQIIFYSLQICDALAYAHKLNIIHRDIKPANVMVTRQNSVKVTDFGIAKILKSDDSTKSGTAVIGTPLYMAPEQITGEGVDARTDIYALGIMMYELVSGHPPFYLGNIEYHHIHTVPPPLPDRVSPNLRDAIMRCVEKDPARRFQAVDEIFEVLNSGQRR